MNFVALVLPVLLVGALYAGLAIARRRLFREEKAPRAIPVPDAAMAASSAAGTPAPRRVQTGGAGRETEELSLAPARLYPRRPLSDVQIRVFSLLLKALPGYVVLPKITYDHFLEARDGSPSENTSLQNRAARHLADFLVCDRKLRALLVCEIDDGSRVPARTREREKMLQKSGLRLVRWSVDQPPDSAALLNTVQTLERMKARAAERTKPGAPPTARDV